MPENRHLQGGSLGPNNDESIVFLETPRQIRVPARAEWIGGPRTYGVEKEMRVQDLWKILVRRKTTLCATMLTCLLAGAIICAFATRRYRALAELQVGRETASSLGLQSDGDREPPSDALAETVTLQTQARILQSDTLALKVIHDLSLESTRDFRPKFDPVRHLMGVFGAERPSDASSGTLEESPQRREQVLEVFRKNLDVQTIPGTRLISISYVNPNPELAAQVVNHLAADLVDYNFQIRHDATSRTAEWLAGQMSDLRRQSEDLQTKVAKLQRESGVFSLGEIDESGREQVYSSVLDELQQSTTALSQAQANRIGKAAIYRVAQTGDPEEISQLSGTSIFASSSGLDSSLSLIQSLRMQEATLRGQVGEMAAKFGPKYPKLSELQSRLDSLSGSIRSEVGRLAARAKSDYEVAQQVEDNARKIYMEQKRQADLANDKSIEYRIARQEADESRKLYESLFRQLKQSGVLAGFRSENVSLVDPARVPAKAARPSVPLYLGAALALGLFLGVGAALLKDGRDARIYDVGPVVESELGQVLLCMLPYHKTARPLLANRPRPLEVGTNYLPLNGAIALAEQEGQTRSRNRGLPALDEPHSAFVEGLRALRTSLLLSKARKPPQVILITSSIPGEGKSLLSSNFAVVLADQRKKVLLVDADLRRPKLHEAFHISNKMGLSWLLTSGRAYLEAMLRFCEQDGQTFEAVAHSVMVPVPDASKLYFVPSGAIPEYPAELLSSDLMDQAIKIWRDDFDYIVIDGSPVLSVTDAVILSGKADFTLLTARHQFVDQQALHRAYGILRSQGGHNNIGIVFNAVQKAAGAYYPSYGYAD